MHNSVQKYLFKRIFKTLSRGPGLVTQSVGASPVHPKGCGFHPDQGTCGRQLIDVSLSLPLSLKSMKTYPWVRTKKKS